MGPLPPPPPPPPDEKEDIEILPEEKAHDLKVKKEKPAAGLAHKKG